MQILPDFSRNNSNETIKYGQLIEYNTRTVCFEKLCTKCSGETSPRSFKKNKN